MPEARKEPLLRKTSASRHDAESASRAFVQAGQEVENESRGSGNKWWHVKLAKGWGSNIT